jgi:predicted ATPase
MAESLRIKGELLLLQGAQGAAAAAEDQYQHALGWARRQGALSWELRAATSLARLLRDQDRSTEAISLLAPVYDRFTEGFETADLRAAKALIDGFCNSKGHNAAAVVELSLRAARRCIRRSAHIQSSLGQGLTRPGPRPQQAARE